MVSSTDTSPDTATENLADSALLQIRTPRNTVHKLRQDYTTFNIT